MRRLVTIGLGVVLVAALWSGIPLPGFADDTNTGPINRCEPGPAYVPGTRLGPVTIGMPLSTVQRQLGRPRSVDNRSLQGHQWTRMLFTGLEVLARDNAVMAVNLAQLGPVPVPTQCGTLVARPLSLPVGFVQQSYGTPSAAFVLNGLRYWLYNATGLLVTSTADAPYVQGLMVYPAGEYCGVVPALVSFGAFGVQPVTVGPCPSTGERER